MLFILRSNLFLKEGELIASSGNQHMKRNFIKITLALLFL